jgi:hypothetical protein
MQSEMRFTGICLGVSALSIAAAAEASEIQTFSYDALGRLVATSSSGAVNNGVVVSTEYDPAGNRKKYGVTGVVGGALLVVPATLQAMVYPAPTRLDDIAGTSDDERLHALSTTPDAILPPQPDVQLPSGEVEEP